MNDDEDVMGQVFDVPRRYAEPAQRLPDIFEF
jgi:hypothetical protein